MGYLGIVLRGRDMPVRASTGTASDAIIGVLGLSSGESNWQYAASRHCYNVSVNSNALLKKTIGRFRIRI